MHYLSDMEERIIELETKIAYQDHLLEELNQLITEQQSELDKLAKQVKDLLEKGENEGEVVDIPPPHY